MQGRSPAHRDNRQPVCVRLREASATRGLALIRLVVVAPLVCATVLTDRASAQDVSAPPETARLYLGPVAVAPTFMLRRLGFDTNVFHERDDPRRDFVASMRMELRTWSRIGSARLSGETTLDLDYFAQYQRERSVSGGQRLRMDLPRNRLRPYLSGYAASTRDAPSYEIDVRVRRAQTEVVAGTEIRVTGKMFVEVSMTNARIDYRDTDTPLGAALHQALNSRTARANGRIRYAITPLTSIVVNSDVERSRFTFSPERDLDGVAISPGVEFGGGAVISGSAHVGYRHARHSATNQAHFKGTFGRIDLSHTLKGATRLSTQLERDINASFQAGQMYYLLSGITATVDRNIGGRWDITGRVGRQRLRYGINQSVTAARRDWTDAVKLYGVSGSFRLGDERRVAVDLDYISRHAGASQRSFSGFRFGLSAIYPL